MLTIWPDEFFTSTCRSDTALLSFTPKVDAAPLDTVTFLPEASTFEPISIAACGAWPADSCVASELSDVFRFEMP